MKRFITSCFVVLLMSAISNMHVQAQSRSKSKSNKPLVVFVVGEHEYSSEATMPLMAKELEEHYGMRTKVLSAFPDQNAEENIPGLEALKDADLVVFFLRWRRLPAEQIKY